MEEREEGYYFAFNGKEWSVIKYENGLFWECGSHSRRYEFDYVKIGSKIEMPNE